MLYSGAKGAMTPGNWLQRTAQPLVRKHHLTAPRLVGASRSVSASPLLRI